MKKVRPKTADNETKKQKPNFEAEFYYKQHKSFNENLCLPKK